MSNWYELKRDWESPNKKVSKGALYRPHKTNRSYVLVGSEEGCPHYVSANTIKNNPKWFQEIKQENKSNDSFQWTDELAEEFAKQYRFSSSRISVKMFKEGRGFPVTPQAENKPDWEIVAYLDNYDSKYIYRKREDGLYSTYQNRLNTLPEHYFSKSHHKIHSVKRLSDGIVFSVGDEVVHYSDYYTEKIKEFIVPEKTPWQMWFHPERNPTTVKSLSNFNKLFPQKLFTTEDGVDKFKGDRCYYVNTKESFLKVIPWYDLPSPLVCFEDEECAELMDISGYKYFHSEEAAEKYIADNKKSDHIGIDRNGEPTDEEICFGKRWHRENFIPKEKVDELCEKAATDFIHYTEFVMNDDSWLCEDGMKSMSDVYKEFVQWKNSKQ